MIQFESTMPVFNNYHERINGPERKKHDDAELVLFAEGLSGDIDDYDVLREDMGQVLTDVGDDMRRWDYVTRFTVTPKVKAAG